MSKTSALQCTSHVADLVSSAVHSTFPSLSIQSSPFFLSPHFLPSVNVSRPNIHLHLHLLLLLCNCTGAFLYLVYLVDILDILSTRRPNLHLLLHHSVLLQRCKVCQFLNIFLNNLMISTHQPPQHPPPPESPAAFLHFWISYDTPQHPLPPATAKVHFVTCPSKFVNLNLAPLMARPPT